MTSFPVKRLSNREKSLLPVAHACIPRLQVNPFGVTWRLMTSLSAKRPNRGGYCATSGWAYAHLTLPREPLRVTSYPLAMLLPVMRNDTFCTTTILRKKRGHQLRVRTRSLPVTWLPITSFPVTWLPVTSPPVAPPWNMTWTVMIYYLYISVPLYDGIYSECCFLEVPTSFLDQISTWYDVFLITSNFKENWLPLSTVVFCVTASVIWTS